MLKENVKTMINPFSIQYIETCVYIKPVFAKTVATTSSNAGITIIEGFILFFDGFRNAILQKYIKVIPKNNQNT